MTKRILFCESNTDGTVGGSYFSLYYLAKGLPKKEFIPIVVFHDDHAMIERFRDSNIDTRVMPLPKPFVIPSTFLPPIKPIQKLLNINRFLFSLAINYAYFLRKEQISLVHLNNSVTRNHAWMIASMLLGIPCITHQRGINDHYTVLDHWIGGKVQAVICISEAVKQNLIAHNFNSRKIKVIYNGLDPEKLSVEKHPTSMLKELGIDNGRPIIGVLGNIKKWKGQEIVVGAMALLKRRFPNLLCLFVCDTAEADKQYLHILQKLVSENELENNVVFTGYKKNVSDWLNLMDIMILSSIEPEPFGRVILEAMAMKKPVIASNAGAVPEIIDNEVSGLLYPPGDTFKLVYAISRLLDNPEERRIFGTAGYERLLRTFHINKNIAQTRHLYSEILAEIGI